MNRRAIFRVAADAVAALALAAAPALSMRRADGRHPQIVNRFEMNGYFTEESAAQIRAMVARDLARARFLA